MALILGMALAGLATLPEPGLALVWLGVPVATLLGWLLGPRAARRSRGSRLLMALGCTAGGAILTGVTFTATASPYAPYPPTSVHGVLGIFLNGTLLGLLGTVVYGLPALLVLYPVAWLWGELVQRLGAPTSTGREISSDAHRGSDIGP
jgi:hypothetical protein